MKVWILGLMLGLVQLNALAQQVDVISDWDNKIANWQNNSSLQTVDNPLSNDQVNGTALCGRTTSTTNQYDLILINEPSGFDFELFSTYRFKVLAPEAGGKVLLKFENDNNTVSTSQEVTPTSGEWQDVEFDLSQESSRVYTKMVIFFDLEGTEAGNHWYIDEIEREGSGDVENPTIPQDADASEISSTEVKLTWSPSSDNTTVAGYKIYQGDHQIGDVPGAYFFVTELTPSTDYTWSISAYDIFGNESDKSNTIEATTLSGGSLPDNISSRFNFRIGTQTIGPHYHFTSDDKLVETAKVIRDMGSNLLKISFGDTYGLGWLPQNLKDIAAETPSFKEVFGMDFTYYHLWAYGPSYWYDGQSEDEAQKEYQAIYDLTKHFLTTYSGTGKTFYLGNWEGDWHLVDDYNTPDIEWDVNKAVLAPETVQGMIDWLNIRQKAVDDARADTEYQNVEVYHYVEANLVRKSIERNLPSLVTEVLPHVDVDYVSYSCYDATAYDATYEGAAPKLKEALDFIESKLTARPGLPDGKRVWIGEFGYPNGRNDFENIGYADPTNEDEQDAQSRNVMLAGLEWGAPFILYWELYDNEFKNNNYNGFWLINDKNEKQKIYYTHRNYYLNAKEDVENFISSENREPTEEELVELLEEALKRSGNNESNTIVLDVKKKNEIVLFPNPAKHFLEISGFYGQVKIIALSGVEVLNLSINFGEKLDVSLLDEGLYTCILSGNVNRQFKLVKE